MFVDENGKARIPTAYLGGYEMFFAADANERGEKMKKLCARYGINGIFPPEPEPEDEYKPYKPKNDSHAETVKGYFLHDINHIRRSDMIIAQLGDYHGSEPDSGTAFECGCAAALGKRLYGFLDGSPERDELFSGFRMCGGGLEDCLKLIRADFDRELVAAGYEPFKVKQEEPCTLTEE